MFKGVAREDGDSCEVNDFPGSEWAFVLGFGFGFSFLYFGIVRTRQDFVEDEDLNLVVACELVVGAL
jgi:hypothetical protein